jgi:photosystem II stability/assembly factor-like uncharacterized protein
MKWTRGFSSTTNPTAGSITSRGFYQAMRYGQIFLLACVLFLSACRPAPAIAFQEYQPADLPRLTDEAAQTGVTLRLTGIRAASERALFLYGGLITASGTLRSVLLRSTDGGQRWQDVMRPEAGSEVTELVFLPGGLGWAVVQWMVGGPGPATLYRSQDHGAHWQRLAELPLRGLSGHSLPAGLQFADTRQGSIRILSLTNLACCRYDTADGGLTWAQTDVCLSEQDCLVETPSETSLEKVSWKYSVSQAGAVIKISRRTLPDGPWMDVSKIPLHYGYAEGKISVP